MNMKVLLWWNGLSPEDSERICKSIGIEIPYFKDWDRLSDLEREIIEKWYHENI